MLSLMIINRTISETIYDGVSSFDNPKDILKAFGQKFKESKAGVASLLIVLLMPVMTILVV